MSRPVLLLTGAGGFLGGNFLLRPWPGYDIVAAYHHAPDRRPEGVRTVELDLAVPGEAETLVTGLRPDLVLHFAAQSNLAACERDPAVSRVVNVEGAAAVARGCARVGARLVFTSTDMVFGGDRAPYADGAVPDPISAYGRQKADAETAVAAACPGALVCRAPLMFGIAPGRARNFFPAWRRTLARGERLRLLSDEYRNPASAGVILEGLRRLVDRGATGGVHLGGPERLSRAAFGRRMCEVLGLDASLIDTVTRAELDLGSPRPADTTMTYERAAALGYDPPPLDDQLAALAAT